MPKIGERHEQFYPQTSAHIGTFTLTPGTGRQAGRPLEVSAEVKLVGIANLFGYFLHGVVAFYQTALCLGHTLTPQPVHGRRSGRTPETAKLLWHAHAGDSREIRYAPRFVIVNTAEEVFAHTFGIWKIKNT